MSAPTPVTFHTLPKVKTCVISVCPGCSVANDDMDSNHGICPNCSYVNELGINQADRPVIFKVVPSVKIPWWEFWVTCESYTYYPKDKFSYQWLQNNKRNVDFLMQAPVEKIHTTIGVYSSGAMKLNGVKEENLQAHIAYNKNNRWGRALFVDGVCVHNGYLSSDKIKEYEQLFKTTLEAGVQIYIRNKDTAPYQ